MALPNNVFLDTNYAIALSSKSDENHQRAAEIYRKLREQKTTFVTTRAVLIEIGDGLSKQQRRENARRLLDSLANDSTITILEVTKSLYDKALHLYGERKDKEWDMTDCISFVIMSEQGL
jgi:predicted nucleic acid-binding protein